MKGKRRAETLRWIGICAALGTSLSVLCAIVLASFTSWEFLDGSSGGRTEWPGGGCSRMSRFGVDLVTAVTIPTESQPWFAPGNWRMHADEAVARWSDGDLAEASWLVVVSAGIPFRSLEGSAVVSRCFQGELEGVVVFTASRFLCVLDSDLQLEPEVENLTAVPLYPVWQSAMGNALVWSSAVGVALWSVKRTQVWMKARRRKPGVCVRCAYRAGEAYRCPECGQPMRSTIDC